MKRKSTTMESLCSRKLKVLADQSRLAVMELLMEGPKHVWELNAMLKLDQSLLSHHLKILRREGFVKSSRSGKAVLYQLAPGIEVPRSLKAINLGCCLLSFEQKSRRKRTA
ncbi:MAG TPA: metalloregulator ArsR/SmtB family transcription factor [Nitrospiria bacterium]|nr:metalloregulator ArsR/SmtB family transcription factor [Nitrospiria bacterium]